MVKDGQSTERGAEQSSSGRAALPTGTVQAPEPHLVEGLATTRMKWPQNRTFLLLAFPAELNVFLFLFLKIINSSLHEPG